MDFAQQLQEARKKARLTLRRAGELVGRDENTVWRWEAGLLIPDLLVQEAVLARLDAHKPAPDVPHYVILVRNEGGRVRRLGRTGYRTPQEAQREIDEGLALRAGEQAFVSPVAKRRSYRG